MNDIHIAERMLMGAGAPLVLALACKPLDVHQRLERWGAGASCRDRVMLNPLYKNRAERVRFDA